MNSMTGYGESKGRLANKLFIRVEIRSVNNRFLSLKMNLPEVIAGYENDIEKLIRQYVQRGTINFSIKLDSGNTQRLVVNRSLLKNYYKELKELQLLLRSKEPISLQTMINLPGVLEPSVKSDYITRREWFYTSRIIKQALAKLVNMRRREGDRLNKTLQNNLNKMNGLLGRIKYRTPQVSANHNLSFRKRLQSILDSYYLDEKVMSKNSENISNSPKRDNKTAHLEQNIAMEIAQFAQRIDVSEEIQRLDSHLNEFSATLTQSGEIGKKLDFLTQEMLREINTIGSKSNDTLIAYAVISFKSELEKIKEQVQNIE